MKSSSKCEVEISITMDGEEVTEPIPSCLQGAFVCTSGEPTSGVVNDIILPPRFTQLLNNHTDTEKQKLGASLASETMMDRERDLGTALRWIKQEMVIMKEQDKILMKQFINLRSKILQLRGRLETNTSTSDLSFDGSTMSLDDIPGSPTLTPNGYLGDSDLHQPEFRARTSSLLSPREQRQTPVTRIRWKSNEYI